MLFGPKKLYFVKLKIHMPEAKGPGILLSKCYHKKTLKLISSKVRSMTSFLQTFWIFWILFIGGLFKDFEACPGCFLSDRATLFSCNFFLDWDSISSLPPDGFKSIAVSIAAAKDRTESLSWCSSSLWADKPSVSSWGALLSMIHGGGEGLGASIG